MAKLTAAQFAEKQARRLQGATEDMKMGVQSVTEAPTKKAAQKADKWFQRISADETKKRYVDGLNKVSLSDWQEKMINKGIPRVAAGIQAARPKVEAFAEKLLAYEDNLKAKVDQMPDLTLEDSANRMTAWMRGMAEFKNK